MGEIVPLILNNFPPWLAALLVVVAAFARLLPKYILKYIEWRHKEAIDKKKEVYTQKLKAITSVGFSMESIESRIFPRVLLVELTNGGDKPNVGGSMHATAIDVKVNKAHIKSRDYILKKYDGVRVDARYIEMCIKAQKEGVVFIDVDKMQDQFLKNWYRAEGIVYSEVYHIYTDVESESMFILSVATPDINADITDEMRTLINIEIGFIRDRFEKYRRL